MAKNILVLSCDIRETRAALIENGIIAELHIERKGRQSSTVGNVYLGKVTRVLPGLQAAFIDIGQERAAFLHVEDLIRPDDFDEYLAGGRKLARGEGGASPASETEEEVDEEPEAAKPADSIEPMPSTTPRAATSDLETTVAYPNWPEPPQREAAKTEQSTNGHSSTIEVTPVPLAIPSDPVSGESVLADAQPSDENLISARGLDEDDEEEEEEEEEADDHEDEDEDEDEDDEDIVESSPHLDSQPPHSVNSAPTLDELPEEDEDSVPPPGDDAAEPARAAEPAPVQEDDDLLTDDMPGFTISEPGEPVPRAPAPRTADRERGERGGRRRRRGRGRGNERNDRGGREGGGARGREGGGARGREGGGARGGEHRGGRGHGKGGRSQGMPGRISKTTPIREVVKEGQEIIVQVTKDPIGTKGARCSSHISLPGRYVVYLPTVDHVGISTRIGNDKERARLREAIEAMKPPSGGLIVRTVAEGLTKKGLKQDVGYLVRLWGEIAKKREGARAPSVLSSELDLVLKVARDLFTDEVDEVVVDDRQQYERLCRFVEMFAPDRVKDVKYYDEDEPIFDEYGIEDEIARALSRKVPLPSGGYLIIDQAEALTAIDVNTGRFVGKGSKDMEETILKTNLEAVHEIAYQLRFRNIGGLIILDLIDMEQHKNREKVRRTLEELLHKDKAKTTLNRISDLGLIEMTRKRTRESLGRMLHEPCFYCDGTGQLQSKETIAYEILREIRRKKGTLPGYSVVVNAHPAVADVLNGTEKAAVQEAENRFMRKIVVTPRKEYHLEQFDIIGK